MGPAGTVSTGSPSAMTARMTELMSSPTPQIAVHACHPCRKRVWVCRGGPSTPRGSVSFRSSPRARVNAIGRRISNETRNAAAVGAVNWAPLASRKRGSPLHAETAALTARVASANALSASIRRDHAQRMRISRPVRSVER